jgi:hypothetical protein
VTTQDLRDARVWSQAFWSLVNLWLFQLARAVALVVVLTAFVADPESQAKLIASVLVGIGASTPAVATAVASRRRRSGEK